MVTYMNHFTFCNASPGFAECSMLWKTQVVVTVQFNSLLFLQVKNVSPALQSLDLFLPIIQHMHNSIYDLVV